MVKWAVGQSANRPTVERKNRWADYMRLKLLLPNVKPGNYVIPTKCPRKGCPGKHFYPRQEVEKKIVDGSYKFVRVWRYECGRCGCTFRVYPQGVGKKQMSQRVIGLMIMLYVLGLSYGAVAIVLDALGIGVGKTSVYRAVQAAAEKVPGMKQ